MIYYVSASGADTNNGMSPETPWKTIGRANNGMLSGDTICFRRGDEFFGRVYPVCGIDPDHPTILRDYGEGKKPVISEFKTINKGAWEQTAENIWRADLTDVSKFTGNTTEIDSNVGYMLISGKLYGNKKPTAEDLVDQWDFACDTVYVYVKSEKSPDELSDEIRMACNITCLRFANCLQVENIVFTGSGAHGMSGSVNHALIKNCEFHNLGGSYLGKTVRYGNGVECWSNSSYVTVDGCRFSQIYDVAITMQGDHGHHSWKDMYFINNLMWNCEQCFEVWARDEDPGVGFENCHFENNICIDAGRGWSRFLRPDKMNASPLLIYGIKCDVCDITVTGNIFSNPGLETVFKGEGPTAMPEGYRIFGNTVLHPDDQPIFWKAKLSDEECAPCEEKFRSENDVYETF